MWYLGSSLFGVFIAISVFFSLSAAGPLQTYLDLQAASDFLHRLVMLSIPGILIVLLLIWMFSELGRLRKWLQTTGRCLNYTCWGLLFALITFVICFDSSLEARGLTGHFSVINNHIEAQSPTRLYTEISAQQPNLLIEGLSNGDIITLDRHTIARKRPDESYIWHIKRPGPPPANLNLIGDWIVYSGRSDLFEDDVQVLALNQISGKIAWRYDCLANAISPAHIEQNLMAFATWRPASSAIRVIDLTRTELLWAERVKHSIRLPPRLSDRCLEVAIDDTIYRYDRKTGDELEHYEACSAPQKHRVRCRAKRIVAWEGW